MRILNLKRVWFVFSGLLVAASIIVLVVFGLRLGVDFTAVLF